MEIRTAVPDGTLDANYWTDDVGDYDNYRLTKYGSYIELIGNSNSDNVFKKIYYSQFGAFEENMGFFTSVFL